MRFAALRAAVPAGGRRSKPSPRFFAIGGAWFRGGHDPRTKEEPRGRMAPGFPFDLDQTDLRRRRSYSAVALEGRCCSPGGVGDETARQRVAACRHSASASHSQVMLTERVSVQPKVPSANRRGVASKSIAEGRRKSSSPPSSAIVVAALDDIVRLPRSCLLRPRATGSHVGAQLASRSCRRCRRDERIHAAVGPALRPNHASHRIVAFVDARAMLSWLAGSPHVVGSSATS